MWRQVADSRVHALSCRSLEPISSDFSHKNVCHLLKRKFSTVSPNLTLCHPQHAGFCHLTGTGWWLKSSIPLSHGCIQGKQVRQWQHCQSSLVGEWSPRSAHPANFLLCLIGQKPVTCSPWTNHWQTGMDVPRLARPITLLPRAWCGWHKLGFS